MRVLIIGASGFIGTKLATRLAADGRLGSEVILSLTLADVTVPEDAPQPSVGIALDLTDSAAVSSALKRYMPDVIFHLAAVVSGDAETNFDLGYSVNVGGTRNLLDAVRSAGTAGDGPPYRPRLVFTSSLAVFGSPLPRSVPDGQLRTPRSSYGTQKAACELLVEDYSRKGHVDGISVRFPSIAVRPGAPNLAASSFISGIVREPLAGLGAVCPVPPDTECCVASPGAAVGYLLRAARLSGTELDGSRTLSVPGLTVSVAEMIEALGRVAGEEVAGLIRHEPDPFVAGIVASWPRHMEATRARALGFRGDDSYDDIIRAYMKEDRA